MWLILCSVSLSNDDVGSSHSKIDSFFKIALAIGMGTSWLRFARVFIVSLSYRHSAKHTTVLHLILGHNHVYNLFMLSSIVEVPSANKE
jgi:hypothetical protein